jgi:hypothetical protein
MKDTDTKLEEEVEASHTWIRGRRAVLNPNPKP